MIASRIERRLENAQQAPSVARLAGWPRLEASQSPASSTHTHHPVEVPQNAPQNDAPRGITDRRHWARRPVG
jgi:hypothetical protein